MVLASLMDLAEHHVVMESLLELNNVMIEIMLLMMDVPQHALSSNYGPVQDNHQFVHIMDHPFVVMVEFKEEKNVMMEILLMEMDVITDVKKNLPIHQTTQQTTIQILPKA
jgi:hypothetical protein